MANIILLAVVVIMFVAGAIAYPYLPDQIASHWNMQGVADDYMPKLWGVFLFPFITAFIYVIYLAIPFIDPLKGNIASFRKHYDLFWILTFLFFLYIFALTLVWNLGYEFSFTAFMVPAIAVLFFGVGVMLEKSKRNWFVGIRTPWTLSSDVVWDKTHKLGGKLFKVSSLLILIGLLFPQQSIFFIVFPAVVIAIFLLIYSFVEYKKQERK